MMYEGNLYRRTKNGLRYIPGGSKREDILNSTHDEIGLWNFATTYKIVSDRFRWPTIRPDASKFVRGCDACQKTNPASEHLLYGKLPVNGLFHAWSIDFV